MDIGRVTEEQPQEKPIWHGYRSTSDQRDNWAVITLISWNVAARITRDGTYYIKTQSGTNSASRRPILTEKLSIDQIPVYHLRRCRMKSFTVSGGCSRAMAWIQPNLYPSRVAYERDDVSNMKQKVRRCRCSNC